ncbi:putative lipid II flippase FtsW [bacterium J17]|nr:putative lipid II flippase FtsW [bacterium J17]
MVFTTGLLLAISILMVFSATAIVAEETLGTPTVMIVKHLVHICVGLFVMFFFWSISPSKLYSLAGPALVLSFLLLILVAIPGVGHAAGGARRWLVIGPLRFQPGELAKLALILYVASYISRQKSKMFRFFPGALFPCVLVAVFSCLLLLEPDFGTSVILLLVVFCQLLTSSRLLHLLGIGLAGLMAFSVLLFTSPYRMRRFQVFLSPFEDPSNAGYQLVQSLVAVGSGGIWGQGLGAGKQKLFYLPAAHTDFIFAVISEELGLIGAVFVLFLFILVAFRGFKLVHKFADRPFKCALALGCTLLIVVPAFLNMGVVTGLLPTKGLVLPLVAYGGTAMVINLSIIGVLLRLSADDECDQ